MTKLQEIKNDLLVARKSKDSIKSNLLGFIIGELALDEKRGHTINDEFVVKTVKKIMNSNIESNIAEENKHLEKYVPAELSIDVLSVFIDRLANDFDMINLRKPEMRDMRFFMDKLRAEFPGQINGKVAAKIVKEKITKK